MWYLIFLLLSLTTDARDLSDRRRLGLNVQSKLIWTEFGIIEQNNLVPMRDGIRLATDIYRFKDDKSYPVLLLRTPYNKSTASTGMKRVDPSAAGYPVETVADAGRYWNMRGYILIIQDVRGRYNSEGIFSKYKNEPYDGFDTIQWIKNQAWCNGKIGMFGASYEAHVQTAALNVNAPLTTIVADLGGFSNSYQGGIRQGGAFEAKQCTWAYNQALQGETSNVTIKETLLKINLLDWFKADAMPWRRGFSPLSVVPDYEKYVVDDWKKATFENDYWTGPETYSAGYYKTSPDIPFMTSSGWYDVYSRAVIENYMGLKNTTKKGPFRLLIGPWVHTTGRGSSAGNVSFGDDANYMKKFGIYYMTWLQHWFDRHLKNIPSPVDSYPPVRIFVMGNGTGVVDPSLGQVVHGGHWRDEKTWPLPDTANTKYFFCPDGSLQTTPPFHTSQRSYLYSPWNPNPTIGGAITSGNPLMWGGAFNQATFHRFFPFPDQTLPPQRLRDRSDVLYFQTPILTEPIEVTGEIEVHLWISSNCTDTDFTAKIVDVYPDGTYNLGKPDWPMGNWTYFDMNIQDGILRTRYRNEQWSNPQLMVPGEIYPIVIKLYPISNIFAKGHRLRIDISSSNFPKYDLNPNTGEPNGDSLRNDVANNKIWMGGLTPSHVILPIIKHPRPPCAIWNPNASSEENEKLCNN